VVGKVAGYNFKNLIFKGYNLTLKKKKKATVGTSHVWGHLKITKRLAKQKQHKDDLVQTEDSCLLHLYLRHELFSLPQCPTLSSLKQKIQFELQTQTYINYK
jgi:hypothetical protein